MVLFLSTTIFAWSNLTVSVDGSVASDILNTCLVVDFVMTANLLQGGSIIFEENIKKKKKLKQAKKYRSC